MARIYNGSFGLRIGVVLVMAPTLLVILALRWLPTVREATALRAEVIVVDKQTILDRGRAVSEEPFEAILARHNRFKAEFSIWRNLVAEHAEALAQLVISFPNGKALNPEHLREIFSKPQEGVRQITGQEVFAPWTRRWNGIWSNGASQYHVWQTAYFRDGQWIQPVSLSEYGFMDFHRVEEKLQRGLADIAINVFSREMGITGWVSKWQNGRVEMPHIGYLIDETTLVWLCQIKSPEQMSTVDNRWFVFLETVDRTTNPQEYKIYGVPLVVEETIAVSAEQMGKHYGTYYSASTITQTKEVDHAD